MGALVEILGLEAQIERMERVEGAALNPTPHLRKAEPYFVGVVKRNFAEGGRPTKWAAKADGSASNLHQSGRLQNVHSKVRGETIVIGSGLVYAAIQHFGGTIVAKSAAFLHFRVGGGWVKVKSVTIPARPFLVVPPADKETGVQIIADSMKDEINNG